MSTMPKCDLCGRQFKVGEEVMQQAKRVPEMTAKNLGKVRTITVYRCLPKCP